MGNPLKAASNIKKPERIGKRHFGRPERSRSRYIEDKVEGRADC